MDARRVVLLNGPAAVGKTTVGRRLAATARNGVCIHGDDLRRMVVAHEPGTVRRSLAYVAGARLADLFLESGYELIVIEDVFGDPRDVERVRRELRARVRVALVTLWAPLGVTLARDRGRPPGSRRGDAAVAVSWAELEAHLSELGPVVDADAPVVQVVDAALSAVES